MLTPKEALLQIEKGKAWPIYFLYGDEPFKIQEFIDKVKSIVFGKLNDEFCFTRLEGSQVTGYEVLDSIQSLGLFGGAASRRVVVVKQAHLIKEADVLASSSWGENILILSAETLDGRRKFHQWLKKNNFVLEFKKAKDAELKQWSHYLAKKLNITITPQAVDLLSLVCEGSLYRLYQEIEKAWIYSGAKRQHTLDVEEVAATSSQNISHEMIELVHSIFEQKRARTFMLLEKLIKAPEDALGLVGFLTWAIKNPTKIGIKILDKQKIIKNLIDLDFRLKTSGLDSQTLVDRFVTS